MLVATRLSDWKRRSEISSWNQAFRAKKSYCSSLIRDWNEVTVCIEIA